MCACIITCILLSVSTYNIFLYIYNYVYSEVYTIHIPAPVGPLFLDWCVVALQ